MKVCPECKTEIAKQTKFCPSCGLIFFSNLPKHNKASETIHDSTSADSIQKSHDPSNLGSVSHKLCPDCGKKLDKGALACSACGLIFYTKPAVTIHTSAPILHPPTTARKYKTQLVAGSLIVCLILGFYYFDRLLRHSIENIRFSSPILVRTFPAHLQEFDLTIETIKPPSGLTWAEHEFVLGNKDSKSFLTVTPNQNRYLLRESFVGGSLPLAWDGREFVGYRESGIFESNKKRDFTIHDAKSLNVVREFPAPETIGGLAWDGTGFWGAARSQDKNERGILYRLDRNLKVVNKLVSPSPTCRGLAWDGFFLWFLDDVEKKIYILDVKGVQIRLVRSFEIPLRSASGIAFDGKNLWISDYDQKSLLRLKPLKEPLWTAEDSSIADAIEPSSKPDQSSAVYHERIRDSGDDVEIASFSSHILSDDLYLSWDIHFGENLFQEQSKTKPGTPAFAKITVTVDGGTLSDPLVKVFDANSGRMQSDSFQAFHSLGQGTYHVGLFIYLQYVDKDGKGRVFSKTIPPLTVTN